MASELRAAFPLREGRPMRRLWMAAALMLSCGGASFQTLGSGGCSITLSGAQSGTFGCIAVGGTYDVPSNRGSVAFQTSGATPVTTVSISFPGEPRPATFSSADAGAVSSLQVSYQTVSGRTWAATAGSGTQTGTYTLVLNSVALIGQSTSGKAYAVSGKVDGTLPPIASSGASGNVLLHADF